MIEFQKIDELIVRSKLAIDKTERSVAYQDGLRLFRDSRFQEAADAVSLYLSGQVDSEDIFLSYRLWIECLSILQDTKSLRVLANHLIQMSQLQEENYSEYVALGGLALLEADLFGRSRLMARCVLRHYRNPYALELIQRLRLRAGYSQKMPILLRCSGAINDYFHWELLSYSLEIWQDRDEGLRHKVNTVIKHSFNAPSITQVLEYHTFLDQGLFAGAAIVAEILHQGHPNHDEYSLMKAFAYFEDGDYPSARKILTSYIKNNPSSDSRILGLLGMCYSKLGDSEKAVEVLETAIKMGSSEGFSVSDLLIELAVLKDELSLRSSKDHDEAEEADSRRGVQNWMIKISQARYFEIMDSSESLVDRLVVSLGNRPMPGDLVFFSAGERIDGEYFWNVVAVYMVDTKPEQHSLYEYLSVLKLVSRLPVTVPIDVSIREDDQEEMASEEIAELGWEFDRYAVAKLARKFGIRASKNYTRFPKGYPYRYRVFQLDLGALELIEKAIENQAENLVDRRHRNSMRRPTA